MMNYVKRWMARLTLNKRGSSTSGQACRAPDDEPGYFTRATSWADDAYTATVVSRNRYQLAFFVAMSLAVLLTIALDVLLPLQHLEPLLIHHYQDGRLDVEPITQGAAPVNRAQVESDLVRYVINRERYDPTSYDQQYALITLLSSRQVAKVYIKAQAASNPTSLIATLGTTGARRVHIDSVVFLDSAKGPSTRGAGGHHDLAQVNFAVRDEVDAQVGKPVAYTALIAWAYQGMPHAPSARWRNWDGLSVTRYSVMQRNV